MDITAHIHIHPSEPSEGVAEKLEEILHAVCEVKEQGREILMVSQEVRVFAQRIDTATNTIAGTVKTLKEKISTGMTPEDVAEANALLDAAIKNLEAIAANPENPTPPLVVPPEGGATPIVP